MIPRRAQVSDTHPSPGEAAAGTTEAEPPLTEKERRIGGQRHQRAEGEPEDKEKKETQDQPGREPASPKSEGSLRAGEREGAPRTPSSEGAGGGG